MKTNKTKPQKKNVKKVVRKKQIEKSLKDRFFEAVKGLGHNAEVIADDIARLSKVASRKLAKTFEKTKSNVGKKLDEAKNKKAPVAKKVKLAKKDSTKIMKRVDKSVAKLVKKAVKKSKPIAMSVKVAPVTTPQKATKSAKATSVAAAEKREVKKKSGQGKTKNNSKESRASAKKATLKAQSNNPVKKVDTNSIPNKPESEK